jgi:hypothetical protein
MRRTDELDAVIACERSLRRRIAERLAEEAGTPVAGALSEEHLVAAEAAIEAWWHEGEEEHDPRAFRPIGPLQELLAEHRGILDRIEDIQDRRLS